MDQSNLRCKSATPWQTCVLTAAGYLLWRRSVAVVEQPQSSAPICRMLKAMPPTHLLPRRADADPRVTANLQMNGKGPHRVWYAFGYLLAGLRAGWRETAFRREAILSVALIPSALWLGHNGVETWLLSGIVVLVTIAGSLNTGLDTAIDSNGPEWHDLSNRAKDMGSTAVVLGLLLCIGNWLLSAFHRFVL